jgi:putative Mg2+ transporter-C (MgtC) family protein
MIDMLEVLLKSIHDNSEEILKIIISFVLGGVIGFERSSKNKPIGFKTCVIISITSCLLTIISVTSSEYYTHLESSIRTDPMRLAAQIISGIGFLGAGVILHQKERFITGLTTAAILWASAAVGIACGAGFFLHAIVIILLIMLTIKVSPKLGALRRQRQNRVTIKIYSSEQKELCAFSDFIKNNTCFIDYYRIRSDGKKGGELLVKAALSTENSPELFYQRLKDIVGSDRDKRIEITRC